jgi:hypothetical protein
VRQLHATVVSTLATLTALYDCCLDPEVYPVILWYLRTNHWHTDNRRVPCTRRQEMEALLRFCQYFQERRAVRKEAAAAVGGATTAAATVSKVSVEPQTFWNRWFSNPARVTPDRRPTTNN